MAQARTISDVKQYMMDNPDELVVSVYEKLQPGILCGFPVDDGVLYAKNIKNRELLTYMEPEFKDFNWSLIWTKIRMNRRQRV